MNVFIKTNYINNDSLIKEAKGLKLLEKNIEEIKGFKTPEILKVSKKELHLEKINEINPKPEHMSLFGEHLAKLHQKRFTKYGLNFDNFIGLNPQINICSENWGEFFYEKRLLFQVNMIENLEIKKSFKSILTNHKSKFIEYLNSTVSHSSIVHGDLWSGNVLFTSNIIYLIDPAVYFADREVDIAMTELFGGFTKEFYESYNRSYKLSSEYENKKIIYNLYHYLNHYNLFGISYLNSCESGFSFIDRKLK